MALCVVIGLFGIGTYIKSGPADGGQRVMREPQRFVDRQVTQQMSTLNQPPPAAANAVLGPDQQLQAQAQLPYQTQTQPYVQDQPVVETAVPPSAPAPQPPIVHRPIARTEPAVYYCGAETKKGTPCARRVKGPTRCYQHVGMPAMALAPPATTSDKQATKQLN